MKVLLVSKCPTHPIIAGNRFLIKAQSEMLKELGCEVHFLYVYETPLRKDNKNYKQSLEETRKFWKDKFHLYKVSKLQKTVFILYTLYRRRFCQNFVKCDDEYPEGLTSYVEVLNHQYHFDIVIINYYYLSKLLTKTNIPKKAVLTHDCFTYRALFAASNDKQLMPNEESKALKRCPNIFVVQDEEYYYYKKISPLSKMYIIYANFIYRPTGICNNHVILFFSGGNNYNINGIRWFVDKIFPCIRRMNADASLVIGGSICNKLKYEFDEKEGVHLYGYVEDPSDFYNLGDIVINPVFQGTGIKIKTFEALSYDKVVLVHPHSIEGIYDARNCPVFFSKNPEKWALFLNKIWLEEKEIEAIKYKNRKYMESLNEFIKYNYRLFLES